MDQVSTPLSSRIRHGLHPDFREVAAQLHRDSDLLTGAEVVDRVLDEVAADFADARVRTFLPLLVHRYATSDLRAFSVAPGGAVPGGASPNGIASPASSAG